MSSNVRTTTLDNGLRIVTDEMSTVETISAGIWIEAGARFEDKALNGVSHMLEHMTFKGTHKRTALQIAEQVEDVGGHLNAYTSRENTAYYAKTLKEDLGLAIDVISDLVLGATLDAEELERERGVILQEIHQAQDTPDDVVFDLFQDAAFPDQPIGRTVLGPADTIRDMSRETLQGYMAERYRPGGMILSASGNLTHDQVVDLAGEAFKDAPTGKGPDHPAATYQGGVQSETRDIEQVHLLLGFEGISFHDDDFYALSVLSNLFGGGMSSRLFQEVREKRGLVYSVYSFLSAYADTGLFGIYAGTGPDQIDELVPVLLGEVDKIKQKVSEDELNRSKAQLKASILMSLESTSSRAEQLARQLMVFGRPITPAEAVAKIDRVSTADIVRLAGRVLTGAPTLATVGPKGKTVDFEDIKARLG